MTNPLISQIPPASRSVIRRLEDLLPQIEDGLSRGYPHASMHAELTKFGINISFAYYERALRLLRQESRNAARALSGTPAMVPAAAYDGELDPARTLRTITKVEDLAGALSGSEPGSVDKVNITPKKPAPFRWKGAELLTKDWSDF